MSLPTGPQSNAPQEPSRTAPSAPAVAVQNAPTGLRPKPRIKAKAKRPVRRVSPSSAIPTPRPAPAPRAPAPEEEEDGFFQRHGVKLIVGGLIVAGGLWLGLKKPSPSGPAPKQERIVMIAPLPPLPPPPPPPPPPKQRPPEEKMEKETAPVEEPKPAEKVAPPKAPDAPAPLGTNLKGDGPGLSGLGGGNGLGGGMLGKGGGSGGSRFGWYAGQVQSKIGEALRRNPKTRDANMRIEVRIWPDSTGRVTRAQLVGSTGDAALDSILRDSVLNGLQLSEPPPAGMKLPINLRLTAQRPK